MRAPETPPGHPDDAATPNPFDLSGRVAMVTGGGRGIGRAISATLATAGAVVAVAELDEDTGRSAVEELRGAGRDASFHQLDVRSASSVKEAVGSAVREHGRIDVLVNNAGIAFNTPAEFIDDEEWLEVMDVNLNGVFRCCRAVGEHMLARGSGAIVNVASMSGMIANAPQPQAHYNASKAGVILLTKSLAGEWAERGVRVNAVSPGYVGTEMTKRGMTNTEWYRTWLAMTPMKRVGEPAEIANTVWYLASDAASYATGTNLVVDGGYTSW